MIFKAVVRGSIVGKRAISIALDGRSRCVDKEVDVLEVPVSEIAVCQFPLKSR